MRFSSVFFLLTLGATMGCARGFELPPPKHFVELDDDDSFAFRAVNADGVVVAVRNVDNDPEGSLTFWAQAIRNRLRTLGGYALVKEERVRARTGEHGLQMRFGRDENARPYVYWLTLFVTKSSVLVVEAGGQKPAFERVQPGIEKAIADLRID